MKKREPLILFNDTDAEMFKLIGLGLLFVVVPVCLVFAAIIKFLFF